MKTFIAIAILTSMTATAVSNAKSEKKREVASVNQLLDVVTRMGERINHLVVSKVDAKTTISISTDDGPIKTKELSQTDFEIIMRKYKNLSVASRIPNECYRSRIDTVLVIDKAVAEQKSSCLGMSTITEPSYAHFVELLVNAL